MGSYVGPAVMTIFLAESGDVDLKYASSVATICSGSSIRPSPSKPLAKGPEVAGISLLPLATNRLIFS